MRRNASPADSAGLKNFAIGENGVRCRHGRRLDAPPLRLDGGGHDPEVAQVRRRRGLQGRGARRDRDRQGQHDLRGRRGRDADDRRPGGRHAPGRRDDRGIGEGGGELDGEDEDDERRGRRRGDADEDERRGAEDDDAEDEETTARGLRGGRRAGRARSPTPSEPPGRGRRRRPRQGLPDRAADGARAGSSSRRVQGPGRAGGS